MFYIKIASAHGELRLTKEGASNENEECNFKHRAINSYWKHDCYANGYGNERST